jgi:hypothetical protein
MVILNLSLPLIPNRIDPRDKLWKKMKWSECGPDELPYGWESTDNSMTLKLIMS